MIFTTHKGVYNLVDPPPDPQSQRTSAYGASTWRALAYGPSLREPQPMGPQPRDIFLYESLGIALFISLLSVF